jgi:polyhydroxybutyrate depolymerase
MLALLCALAILGCGNSSSSNGGNATQPASCQASGQAGTFTKTIQSNGTERQFRLVVPSSIDLTRPVPLVLNFHGLGSNAGQQETYTGMAAKAESAGFITAAGEGIDHSWNAGEACCNPAHRQGIDDVQFARDMVTAISAEYCIDPRRIFATGMSNGGFMSNRLACDAADLFAAVAPVASFLGLVGCAPSRPIPIMMFNGTDDPLVPYTGCQGGFRRWTELNGCSGAMDVTFENGDSRCESAKDCAASASTTLCTITGGGHTWPGSSIPLPRLGNTTQDLNATDAMWDFFVAHPMP